MFRELTVQKLKSKWRIGRKKELLLDLESEAAGGRVQRTDVVSTTNISLGDSVLVSVVALTRVFAVVVSLVIAGLLVN